MSTAPEPKKVAIITGASQGIGAGLVAGVPSGRVRRRRHLALDPALDEPDFLTVRGDIADAETAQRVVEQALDRFGRIDSLVNNAGIFIGKPFTDYTARRLRRDHRREPGRVLPHHPAGHPTDGRAGRRPHRQHHHQPRRSRRQHRPSALASLTKGGLVAVTRSLAIEYASRGVRVNAVSLGVIKTPVHDPASYDGMAALHPLGRVGEISDVVDGVLYLEQATFVTGETLHIDGGQAAGH